MLPRPTTASRSPSAERGAGGLGEPRDSTPPGAHLCMLAGKRRRGGMWWDSFEHSEAQSLAH